MHAVADTRIERPKGSLGAARALELADGPTIHATKSALDTSIAQSVEGAIQSPITARWLTMASIKLSKPFRMYSH